jgi:hypothetical protein
MIGVFRDLSTSSIPFIAASYSRLSMARLNEFCRRRTRFDNQEKPALSLSKRRMIGLAKVSTIW